MKSAVKIIGFVLFATLLIIRCSKIRSGNDDVTYLARVGSSYLTLQQAQKDIPSSTLQQDRSAALATYRDRWIHRQLLLNKADNLQLEEQKEVQAKLKAAHNEVLINALKKVITQRYKNQAAVSDTEALNYYHDHKNKLVLKERYIKFRHIETPDLGDARRARDWLQKDSAWTKVANTYSINPEKKIRNGNKYWPVSVVFNDFPIMKKYASRLDSGQISPIQRYEGMYHFIQLTAVREQGESADPHWFIEQVKEWLNRERQHNYYNSYVKNLYLRAKEHNEIEVFNVSISTLNDKTDSVNTR